MTSLSVFAVAFSMMIVGCNSGMSGKADLNSNIDSVSYSIGYNVGKQMKSQGMNNLEPKVFAKAMNQALNGDTAAISQATMMSTLRSYQMKARQKQQKDQMQKGKNNIKKGQSFLMKNKKKDGVKTTPSGLQYKVIKKGSGASPDSSSTVLVNYDGTLLNGKTFDKADSASIPLNHVIPGWTEGIQMMHEGATYKFWIPGNLAYGAHPRPGGPIGPNELLIFKVDLLKVKK